MNQWTSQDGPDHRNHQMPERSLPIAKLVWVSVIAAALISFGAPVTAQDARDAVFAIAHDQTMVHKGSGLRFPQDVAGFRRTGSNVFDPAGEYVGVRYSKTLVPEAAMDLRIAVVRIMRMTPKEHYVIMKPKALRTLTQIHTVVEGPYNRPGNQQGYRGIFAGVQNGRPTMVGLWAFQRGNWDLRARAEFPSTYRAQAERSVEDFVVELGALNRRK